MSSFTEIMNDLLTIEEDEDDITGRVEETGMDKVKTIEKDLGKVKDGTKLQQGAISDNTKESRGVGVKALPISLPSTLPLKKSAISISSNLLKSDQVKVNKIKEEIRKEKDEKSVLNFNSGKPKFMTERDEMEAAGVKFRETPKTGVSELDRKDVEVRYGKIKKENRKKDSRLTRTRHG